MNRYFFNQISGEYSCYVIIPDLTRGSKSLKLPFTILFYKHSRLKV